jgi:hypothetical protein
MPRMIRRAAVLGATAHVASQRGEAKAEAAAQQQQVPAASAPPAAPQPAPAAVPAPTSAAPAPASNEEMYADLPRLKELLDAGILTQAEFDAKKQQILGA